LNYTDVSLTVTVGSCDTIRKASNPVPYIHMYVCFQPQRTQNNEAVQVVVRCRPMNEKETAAGYSW